MAEYELIDTRDKIIQKVADSHGVSFKVAEDIWESQWAFLHDCIRNRSVKWEKYPGVLLPGFGKFYCTHGKLGYLKKIQARQSESI